MSSLLRSLVRPASREGLPISLDTWASYFQFGYNGLGYGGISGGTLNQNEEAIAANFEGYVNGAYKGNGIVFACMLARLLLFSEARFQYRQIRGGRPGDLFGTPELALLEKPWPNGTTGDLLTRAIQDVDLAGNFYAARRAGASGPVLRRLRPDWVTILLGSNAPPPTGGRAAVSELDLELAGYSYQPGGPSSGEKPIVLFPEHVAHFAPTPDPVARYRGMSWLTTVINETLADNAATTHKLQFFRNGATPNMVVALGAGDERKPMTPKQFQEWVDVLESNHEGMLNAYKTLYLASGSDAKVIGADMKQIDFKVTQGAGETRIAAAAGVPPVIVGLSEGLQAATYSNYSQARRRFADGTMRPLWRNMAGSLATVVTVPAGAELWYDDRDIPFLREDEKDAAEIQKTQAESIKALTEAGYEPTSVMEAVTSGDLSRLTHSGMFSVQLHPPGTIVPGQNGNTPAPAGQP